MSARLHEATSIRRARMDYNRIGRIATWFCVTALLVLSLVPGNERPHTGIQGHWEHFIAYAGTGLIATLAYDRAVRTIVGLCLLSSVLELLQNFIPGRTPTLMDAVFSTAGGAAGAALAMVVRIVLARSADQKRRQNK